IVVLMAVVGALALAPSALAVQTVAPPGNSSAGEYLETVPTANGNRRSDSFPGGSGGGHRGGPPAATVRRLDALGSSGKGALAFAQRTGSNRARPSTGTFSRPAGSVADAGTSGPSPLDAIVK